MAKKPLLDPLSIAAGLTLLTPDQQAELADLVEEITDDSLEWAVRVSAYLLDHVGLAEIQHAVCRGYGDERLRDALLLTQNGDFE
jgi:hypothetical protein